MEFNDIIVQKPWGYEYLVYENDDVALWLLHIKKDGSTSMHCHPSKTTGLILISGEADVIFLGNTVRLNPIEKIMIRRGLFHSTTAISDDTYILEIETPKAKTDLIRLGDKYGRENQPYEGSEFYIPSQIDRLTFSENNEGFIVKKYNTEFQLINLDKHDNFINNLNDDTLIMFLSGGILSNDGQLAIKAGDVGFSKIVKKITNIFKQHIPNTLILIMKKL